VFNILGPLANPARVRRQVTGVADPSMAERMAEVLRANGTERALVVHGHDGLDELTTTTTSTVYELQDGDIRIYVVDPRPLGLGHATLDDLRGGDAATNADMARRVLDAEAGPRRDIVILNAAAGLVASGRVEDLAAGLDVARAAIDSGAAAGALERLVAASQTAKAAET
jgi:anthranilate phosphoribosyltransferase